MEKGFFPEMFKIVWRKVKIACRSEQGLRGPTESPSAKDNNYSENNPSFFKVHPFIAKYGTVFTILFILAVSLFIRRDVYLMPHFRGDQKLYVASAMRLDGHGITEYSFRGIDVDIIDDVYAVFSEASYPSRGTLLTILSVVEKVDYYDMPVLTTPPLFGYALMFAHRLIGPEEGFVIPYKKWSADNGIYTKWDYAAKQFYAISLPLFFSCMLIMLTFFIGRHFFGVETAAWGAFFIAICPTNIMTSQRIWADDMTAFFVVLAIFLFLKARQRDNPLYSTLAGYSAGLASVTKGLGIYVVFVILFYQIWLERKSFVKGDALKSIFDKHLLLFLVSSSIVLLPWYGHITKTYGVPWYLRDSSLVDPSAPWFVAISSRPWFLYFVNIPVQTPLLFLGYFLIIDLFRRSEQKDGKVLMFLWFSVYLVLLRHTREERYMLPAIPALAIASGIYLKKFRVWLCDKGCTGAAVLLVLLLLILSVSWSVPLGRKAVLSDESLILCPF